MIFRIRAVGLAALCLTGCQAEPPEEPAPEPATEPAAPSRPAGAPLPQTDVNASLEPLGEPSPLPSPTTLRFVGRWAAEERLCRTTAWRFTETELRTPAGSVCRFTDVRTVPGGYDISARCTAEAPERDDVLRIRFAESARALLFESDSIAEAGLVYCGE